MLVPALFVLCSAFMLWLTFYVITTTGVLTIPFIGEFSLNLGLSISSFQDLLVLLVPLPSAFLFVYIGGAVILASWYFAVARYYRVDILWEQWFAFTCWTLVPMIIVPSARFFITILEASDDPYPVLSIFVVALFYLLPVAWTVFLTQQGLRVWTAKGKGITFLISVIPYLLYVLFSVEKIVELMKGAFS